MTNHKPVRAALDIDDLAQRIVRYIRVDTESLGHDWDAKEWEVAEQSAKRTLLAALSREAEPAGVPGDVPPEKEEPRKVAGDEELRALMKKWRGRAKGFLRNPNSLVCIMAATQNEMCADELEVALANRGKCDSIPPKEKP